MPNIAGSVHDDESVYHFRTLLEGSFKAGQEGKCTEQQEQGIVLLSQARQIVRSFMEDTSVTGAHHESVMNYEADTNTSLIWVHHMSEMLPVSCLIQVFACRVGEKTVPVVGRMMHPRERKKKRMRN